jgi:hypothetical protein
MKKKEFVENKLKYLGALANGKTKRAAQLKAALFAAILDRKARGKKLGRFNFR